MGREVKRVPLDFDWPMKKVWGGFLRPDENEPVKCIPCDGTGQNPETKRLSEDWYDSAGFQTRWWYDYETGIDGEPAKGPPWKIFGQTRAWQYDLTQEEVDHLIAKGRLSDLVSTWDPVAREWKRDPSKPWPTAAQVNRQMQFGFGHDSINHWTMVEFRAKRLGIWGNCSCCDGEGYTYRDDAHRAAYDGWEETPVPEGPGYQMWENTSEGSPMSPVFDTPTKLAAWLVRNRASSFGDSTATFASWMAMIEDGWAPSAIGSVGKGMQSGVSAALKLTKPVVNLYPIDPEPGEKHRRYAVAHLTGWEDDHRVRYEPPTATSRFEAIFPAGDAQQASVAEFKAWMDERRIEVENVSSTGDVIFTGPLMMDQGMEFKMRWV